MKDSAFSPMSDIVAFHKIAERFYFDSCPQTFVTGTQANRQTGKRARKS
ncbi:hypothetical protein D3OALGB2SA_1768 [Olavius algarvensis associated proteobacterium Delta 3]|nr:hypothetical protein D3OALGB2SA_1768 [Olavius algarvensis associated proteobacterium Delta 3]